MTCLVHFPLCTLHIGGRVSNFCCGTQAYIADVKKRSVAAAPKADGLPAGVTLEDPSVLLAPGTRDGQTKVVRENGGGMAYGWSATRCEPCARSFNDF